MIYSRTHIITFRIVLVVMAGVVVLVFVKGIPALRLLTPSGSIPSDRSTSTAELMVQLLPPQPDNDKDSDGVDDTEEKEIGTSTSEVDSDGDGLSDGIEISVLQTDPLNPDTDGDGYRDGIEVTSGFNPNGEGKLIQS